MQSKANSIKSKFFASNSGPIYWPGIAKDCRAEEDPKRGNPAGAGSVRGIGASGEQWDSCLPGICLSKIRTAPADLIGMAGYVIEGHITRTSTLATPEHAFGE